MANALEMKASQPAGLAGPLLDAATLPPFADVAHAHLDRLYGFCLRLTTDPSDAEVECKFTNPNQKDNK